MWIRAEFELFKTVCGHRDLNLVAHAQWKGTCLFV
jgi:hypothetical protein